MGFILYIIHILYNIRPKWKRHTLRQFSKSVYKARRITHLVSINRTVPRQNYKMRGDDSAVNITSNI